MLKVLVVGQTPPPFHGQAVMIEKLLAGKFEKVQLHHVSMRFSRTVEEVGRFAPKKLGHLAGIIARIALARWRHGARVLYYPPAGPNRVPVYRDMAILLAIRWMFDKTVFHFHAGGLSELYERLNPMEQRFFRMAYFHPDCVIRLSDLNPSDGECLEALTDVAIPHGIEDVYPEYALKRNIDDDVLRILFVGVLRESKGVLVLLEACRILKERGEVFRLQLMGRFQSPVFEAKVKDIVSANGMEDQVVFLGVLDGNDKWNAYARADIFCFPTFYEAETFGVVVLEAMQFELPVVATKWRGVSSLVRDDESGLLVPIHDAAAVAECLGRMIQDPDLRRKMGKQGREIYLKEYSLDQWHERMEQALLDVVGHKTDNLHSK